MAAPDLISGFYSTSGTVIGLQVSGFMFVPWASAQGGVVLSDPNGQLWLLQMRTDGRLTTAPISV